MLNKLKLLAIAGAAVAALGLAPAAIFADDGDHPGDYTYELNARTTPGLTPAQATLQAMQALVSQCFPGASVVNTQVLPDRCPSYILVSITSQDGSQAFDQKLDASFVNGCVAGVGNGVGSAAVRVAGMTLLRDAALVLQDDQGSDSSLSGTGTVGPSSANLPSMAGGSYGTTY